MESDLTFLGLLIMENRLKRETKPVLEELSDAHIRSVMVTGTKIGWIILTAASADRIQPHVSEQSAALSPALVRRHRHLCPTDNYSPRSTCAVTIT